MLKIFYFIFCFILTLNFGYAQSIKRSVINSFGSSSSNGTVYLSETFGQPSNISTVSDGNNFIRQGFEQPLNNLISIPGCTDSLAFNYDVNALIDDGTCIPFVYGCTDSLAFNFDINVNTDDGSCIAVVNGCTDSLANNYNPFANIDNETCLYSSFIFGCTDSSALNYNSLATFDDSSCCYSDQIWAQIGQDINGDFDGILSGFSVALSSDGNIVAVGSPRDLYDIDNPGFVKVFENYNGVWLQKGQNIIDINNDKDFGFAISLDSLGTTIAIGSPNDDENGYDNGSVSLYKFIDNNWIQIGNKIFGIDSVSSTGIVVSLSSSGTKVAFGSSGHVKVFENINENWTQIGQEITGVNSSRNSVSLNSNGNVLTIGRYNDSDVIIYEYIDGFWFQIGNILGYPNTQFGLSVSSSSSGSRVAIGAPQSSFGGTVSIFENIGDSWTQIGQEIHAESSYDGSGRSVFLSSDGNTVAIGAEYNNASGSGSQNPPDNFYGHVRVYKFTGENWIQIGQDIDGEAAVDLSGYSVSLNSIGDRVAIGSPYNDNNGINSGSVKLFEISTPCNDLGCLDPLALNFDPYATANDSSCVYSIYGCTDPNAFNYDINANTDDGSCNYCSNDTIINLISSCESYEWNGETYIESGEYSNTYTNSNGCDSVAVLNLTITQPDTSFTEITACESYEWNGQTYSESGEYSNTYTNINGCDSIHTLNLTLNSSTVNIDTQIHCNDYTWIDGVTYTESNNSATFTLTNTIGCDSIVTLDLTILESTSSFNSVVACDSFEWNGQTYTESGEYSNTYTNVNSCDSVAVLNLTITQPDTSFTDVTACESYEWDGQTYTESGEYSNTYTNINGCDSIHTLNLTLNSSTVNIDTQIHCNDYTWIDGVTYTESNNSATFTLTNTIGCDSIVTLDLTILESTSSFNSVVACDSFEWNGQTYTESGEYSNIYTNINSCDSVAVLNLTITQPDTSFTDVTACESYEWNGETYTESGTYEYSELNNNEYSMSFDGSNYVSISDNPSLNWGYNNFSVSAWVNKNNSSPWLQSIVTKKESTSGDYVGWNLGLVYNQIRFIPGSGTVNGSWVNNGSINSNFTLNDNQWYYITGVFDGTNSQTHLYVDGILIASEVANYSINPNNSQDLKIGVAVPNGAPSGPEYFYGNIDDIYIWSTALSQSEIQQYMNCPPTGNEEGLVGYWNFDEGEGETVIDLSGNGNDGIINGATYSTDVPEQSCQLTSVNGCDSVAVLNLTITQPDTSYTEVTACESYEWNGQTYTESGTSTYTFSSIEIGANIEGGIVFHVDSSSNLAYVATQNYINEDIQWGCSNFDVDGAESTSVGGGYQNTQDIINASCGINQSAALTCVNYDNGYNDWFLPSLEELYLIYENLYQTELVSYNTGNSQNWYWSSTEGTDNSTNSASNINFSDGFIAENNNKDSNGGGVIAVRTFSINNSCDSVAVLNLTINQSDTSIINVTTCESYQWNGETYTESGTYEYSELNNNEYSMSFDGVDDYIFINHNESLSFGNESISYEMWFRKPLVSHFSQTNLVTNYITPTVPLFGLYIGGVGEGDYEGKLGLHYRTVQNQSEITCKSISRVDDNLWHHVVGVKNTSTDSVYLFVDGLLVNQSYILSGNNDTYQGLVIGGHHLNRYMDVEIDELRIWNRALSIHEIQQYMNCPPTGNEEGLVGYWNFEQGEGEIVIDLSGNGNDGNINGATYSSNVPEQSCQLQTINGCDSVAVLNLTIIQSDTSFTQVTACDEFTWDGQTYTESGEYTNTYINANGCDSTHTLNLIITEPDTSFTDITACESYEWNGQTYTESGTYEYSEQNNNEYSMSFDGSGDNIIVANDSSLNPTEITIAFWTKINSYGLQGQSGYNHFVNKFVGNGDIQYVVANNFTGLYAYINSQHYDSNVLPSLNQWEYIVFSYSSSNGEGVIYLNGDTVYSYNSSLQLQPTNMDLHIGGNSTTASYNSVDGWMDEVHIWNRVLSYSEIQDYMNCPPAGNEEGLVGYWNFEEGEGDTVYDLSENENHGIINGATYSTDVPEQSCQLTTVNGCDSLAVLNLTISQPDTSFTEITACESYDWNGETYIESGEYSNTYTNVNGCDSVAVLNLTITQPDTSFTEITACESFEWNGQTYTESGEYSNTYTNINSCDSVAVLNLTITQPDTSFTQVTACESYEWNGQTYTESGTYEYSEQNNNEYSMSFDGVDDYINSDLNSALSLQDATWMVWCYFSDINLQNGIIAQNNGYNTDGYFINTSNVPGSQSIPQTSIYLSTAIGNTNQLAQTWTNVNSITANQWHHIAISLSNGVASIYIDGIYNVAGNNFNHLIQNSNSDLLIGCGTNIVGSFTQAMNGKIEDLSVWNISLTQQQIQNYMNCPPVGNESGLVGYWNFEEGEGETVIDLSGNGNDGIINGATYSTDVPEQSCQLTSVNGCDSVAILNLTITEPDTSITEVTACESYEWNGQTYTESGEYSNTYTNINSCDSVAVLNLTITQPDTSFTEVTACESYEWNGQTYTESGTYTQSISLNNEFSMSFDGINDYVHLTSHNYNSTSYTVSAWINAGDVDALSDNVIVSRGNSYDCFYNPYIYIKAGNLSVKETGCNNSGIIGDIPINNGEWNHIAVARESSTVNVYFNGNLILTDESQTNPWLMQGETSIGARFTQGTYNDFINGSIDEIIIWDIALSQQEIQNYMNCPPTGSETGLVGYWNFEEGQGDTVFDLSGNENHGIINGATYSTDVPEQSCQLTSVNGCDSVAVLNLTITQPDTSFTEITACESFEWNGQTYTESGEYSNTYTNINGCDSIHTLNLTLNSSTVNIDTQIHCNDYTWIDGVTYTESNNSATYLLTDQFGCDSIVSLDLTISYSGGSIFVNACDSYEWNGETYTESGTYINSYLSNNGCISNDTLQLNIDICGCTDELADNYDPNANFEDGSCIYCNSFSVLLISVNDVSEIGGNNGQVIASGQGGSSNYSYYLYNSEGIPQNPFSLYAGTYTIEVIDYETFCIAYLDVEVNEPTLNFECTADGCIESSESENSFSSFEECELECSFINPCNIIPTGLYVDNIIHNRIRFNWSQPEVSPSHYMIRYREVGTNNWTVIAAGPQTPSPFNGTSRTRYFMEPETTYEWNIRARVLNEDGSINCQSDWSETSTYTTLPACANLENLSVSTEATWVTFFADAPDESWGVWQSKGKIREVGLNNYRYVNGDNIGNINGLKGNFTANTDYEWHTKAWCTGNVDENGNSDPQYHSGWGEFSAFTTEELCDKLPINLSTSTNSANTAVIMSWDSPLSGNPDHYFLEMTNNTSGAVYQWNNIAGTDNSKTKFNQSPGDDISWRIRGACGTNGTSWATIFTQPTVYTLGGEKLQSSSLNSLEIYPNPSRDVFNIELSTENTQQIEIRVVNSIGQEIYREKVEVEGNYTEQIDLSDYSKGIYNLTIKTNTETSNHRLILQ